MPPPGKLPISPARPAVTIAGGLIALAVIWALWHYLPITVWWDFFRANPAVSCLLSIAVGFGIACRFRMPDRWKDDKDIVATLVVVSAGLLFGFYLISRACGYAPADRQPMVVNTAMGWACAYFGVGVLVGFLFGIPRVVQGQNRAADPAKGNYQQRVNTNLEEISDWLTKIIVGLGLVQLRTVPGHLHRAAQWMARSFVPQLTDDKTLPEAAVSFAGAFIVFFSILGFLGGYLATRLYLSGAFGRADQRTVEKDVNFLTAITGDDKTNIEKLRKFWRPGGAENGNNKTGLESWLKASGLGTTSLPDFLNLPRFADKRKDAVLQFKL